MNGVVKRVRLGLAMFLAALSTFLALPEREDREDGLTLVEIVVLVVIVVLAIFGIIFLLRK